jgi:hypothetical protein
MSETLSLTSPFFYLCGDIISGAKYVKNCLFKFSVSFDNVSTVLGNIFISGFCGNFLFNSSLFGENMFMLYWPIFILRNKCVIYLYSCFSFVYFMFMQDCQFEGSVFVSLPALIIKCLCS